MLTQESSEWQPSVPQEPSGFKELIDGSVQLRDAFIGSLFESVALCLVGAERLDQGSDSLGSLRV